MDLELGSTLTNKSRFTCRVEVKRHPSLAFGAVKYGVM